MLFLDLDNLRIFFLSPPLAIRIGEDELPFWGGRVSVIGLLFLFCGLSFFYWSFWEGFYCLGCWVMGCWFMCFLGVGRGLFLEGNSVEGRVRMDFWRFP